MAGFRLNTTESYFDVKAVLDPERRAKKSLLLRFGLYTRDDARRSLRSVGIRGKAASAGSPPHSRLGLLKNQMFFALEANTVVCGPAKLSGRRPQSRPAPEVLEVGGSVTHDGHTAVFVKRPFMKPALDRNIRKISRLLEDQVR